MSSSAGITFPVVETGHKTPEIIFCHGLGSSWECPLPLALESYVTNHFGNRFVRFQYRFLGDETTKIWRISNWIEDIVALLDRNPGESIIFACSGSAQAAVEATLLRPEKVHSLLLLSPGIGITLDFVDRLRPGSIEQLLKGEIVYHPALPGAPVVACDMSCIKEYMANDILLKTAEKGGKGVIPIHCPVRILHGMKDFLVPYRNALEFASRLQSESVEVRLIKKAGHIVYLVPEVLEMVEKTLGGKEEKLKLVTELEAEAVLLRKRQKKDESKI